MDYKEIAKEYYKEIKLFLDEAIALNQKYGFSVMERPKKDKARAKWLWNKIENIRKDFTGKYPISPCPECGEKRFALMGGNCINWRCKKSPPLGG